MQHKSSISKISITVIVAVFGIASFSSVFALNEDKITPEQKSWLYYLNPDDEYFLASLELATDAWHFANTDLSFTRVGDISHADVVFVFEDIPDSIVDGRFDSKYKQSFGRYFDFDRKITIDYGLDTNCRDEILYYSQEHIADIIKHEIGHMLGLEHSLDPSHLMHSDTQPTSWDFDALGYIIPERYSTVSYYQGQKELNEKYDMLLVQYEDTQIQYLALQMQYNKFPDTMSSEVQYEESVQVYARLSQLFDKLTFVSDDLESMRKQINCFSSESHDTANIANAGLQTWTYYQNPDGIYFLPAIHMAVDAWSEANPQLKFTQVTNVANADIVFVFDDILESDIDGLYDIQYDSRDIHIDYGGDLDCKGEILYYSQQYIADTIKHMIPYVFGLEPSFDPNRLTRSSGNLTTDSISEYVMPERQTAFRYYAGEQKLYVQHAQLLDSIDKLNARHVVKVTQSDKLVSEFNYLLTQYDDISQNALHDKSVMSYDQISDIDDKLAIISEDIVAIHKEKSAAIKQAASFNDKITCFNYNIVNGASILS